MTYFELFRLPVTLQPDAQQVKKQFYALSRQYHPDFFANASEAEQAEALEKSSLVNKAFKIFQSQDETIKYVLREKGLLQDDEKYHLPPDFLMEMMELNEQLMDAKMEGDETALNNVKSQISNLKSEIYEPVAKVVADYQEGITTEKELLQVKEFYYKKKYLDRILAGMN
ncbi:MAG: DnaJ domain-containing protein [Filimonas sp.]|nr:DnaJ domain-containing protein [Filimonas sp.]